MNDCPICGRPLYLEGSTGDPVCLSCCKMKSGDHYSLLEPLCLCGGKTAHKRGGPECVRHG